MNNEFQIEPVATNCVEIIYRGIVLAISTDKDNFSESDTTLIENMVNCLNKHYEDF